MFFLKYKIYSNLYFVKYTLLDGKKNPAVSSGILCKQFRRLIYDVQSFLLGTVFDFLVFLVALHQDVGERRGQEH